MRREMLDVRKLVYSLRFIRQRTDSRWRTVYPLKDGFRSERSYGIRHFADHFVRNNWFWFQPETVNRKPETVNRKPETVALVAFMLLFFSACLKEEEPVTPPNMQGNVETAQIPMGKDYSKQFFFDLGTNSVVSSNNKTDWDLAFECGTDDYHIFLNSSKLMFASNTFQTDFTLVTSADSLLWTWDVASGNSDSTAIGEWGNYADRNVISHRHVYLIHRGKDAAGSDIGIKKLVLGSLLNDTYTIKFANLDGTDEHIMEISKDNDFSRVYFSFDNGGEIKTIEPAKDAWDIEFTVYTHIFSETPDNIQQPDTLIPYLVTGVLQNPDGVAVAEYFNKPFADITLNEAMNLGFVEGNIDVIGYDWKYFNFEAVTYDVLPNRAYIIRDTEGYLYKLQFIDFYSTTGEKGYPKFEFQRL